MALALAEHSLTRPFVLQLGANDGKRFDCLHPFLEHSCWSGLLVEGDPILQEQLRLNNQHREPRIRTLNCVVGDGEPATFYSPHPDKVHELPDWALGIGGFDADHIDRHAVHFPGLADCFTKRSVTTITINNLIRNHLGRTPDVLFMDLEGYDANILEALDYASFSPKIIIFESAHAERSRMNSLFSMLGAKGYLVHWGPGDSVAMHASVMGCQ
ncbi:FkbM family methyltransferase [Cyanobium sp. Morenito 9A2]|uniref:FkbM family methyltransferase n=1 Tax=Cyanobium sp. Morenito 9A2 TaxID=2823718 RepID=UPI0037BFFF1F